MRLKFDPLRRLASIVACLFFASTAQAQLTDITQTPNPINAGIGKSLEQQVGAGRDDAFTPGRRSIRHQ